MQHYSDPSRADDTWSLPDVETFPLTAHEFAEMQEDLILKYSKRHEFRLATMNSATRERMLGAMIEEEGIKGGWFYYYCLPGCMPDSDLFGPYETEAEAALAAQDNAD